MSAPRPTDWVRSYAEGVAGSRLRDAAVRWRGADDAAWVATVGEVVVKLHHPRTDAAALRSRLCVATSPVAERLFVQPLSSVPAVTPEGRLATAWPRVEVLRPEQARMPWSESGALLATLHRLEPADSTPAHGGPARLERAVARARARAGRAGAGEQDAVLAELGERLLREARASATCPGRHLAHGDWHLGQLGLTADGWRLLDVDDIGTGEPGWDLARPAGFWACGLLDDPAWEALLEGYRRASGPAVPAAGDPWPALDLPARCAVLVAALRETDVQRAHSSHPADALLAACRRM